MKKSFLGLHQSEWKYGEFCDALERLSLVPVRGN